MLHDIPFVDLHIISVSRYTRNDEGIYEKGVRAYLIKEGNHYKLSFNHTKDSVYEGIFFKEIGTDFDNGLFRFMKGAETLQVQVCDGLVTDFTNIEASTAMSLDDLDNE